MEKIQWIKDKIVSRETLIHRVGGWKLKGKKIVFTNGVFDILHRGHIDYLANAASKGNILIVGVNTDKSVKRLKGENRPLNNQEDRAFQLAALLSTNAICFFEEDTPEELIKAISPHMLAKGGDYTEDTIAGASFVKAAGGSVEVIPFISGYSTTSFIEKIKRT